MTDDSVPLGLSIDSLYRGMIQSTQPAMGYARKGAKSLAAWQKALRAKLLELLAIEGKPRPAPTLRWVESAECDGYTRRRGYLLAADGLAVPLFALEPNPRPPGRMGFCIAAHGHGPGKAIPAGIAVDENARKLIVEGQRDYAVQAVQRGFISVVPDFRGFGELMLSDDVAGNKGDSCTKLSLRGMHLGKPLLGQRVSDVMQLVDWALSRDDVDPRRVLITGNSGGGTMSLFAAACDGRISAAAPSCYFSTFADSILSIYHCACNFVPGLQAQAEMSDLAGLIAPRPMLIIAGTKDTIFPIDAVRAGFAAAKRIYADAGAPDHVELYEGDGGHRYYSARAWNFFHEKLGR